MATWAKSKRRFIRREELLAFLAEDSPGQVLSVDVMVGSKVSQKVFWGLGIKSRYSILACLWCEYNISICSNVNIELNDPPG